MYTELMKKMIDKKGTITKMVLLKSKIKNRKRTKQNFLFHTE